MAEAVVDVFERVDVEHEKRKFALFTPGDGDIAAQLIVKQVAVGQTGERIVARQALEILVDLVELRGEATEIIVRFAKLGFELSQTRPGTIAGGQLDPVSGCFQALYSELFVAAKIADR